MDFKAARETRELTLKQVSEIAGYSIATINALELEGRGSDRLKEKLQEIYQLRDSGGMVLCETAQETELEIWRRRAKTAEKKLSDLRDVLREALANSAGGSSASSEPEENPRVVGLKKFGEEHARHR
jgi:transcriptional regulator with XRE-family HTH domain